MSIRGKIFGWLLLFCAVLIGLLWLFQVVFLDSVYRRVKTAEVNAAMSQIAANAESGSFEEIADNIHKMRNIDIGIITPNGSLVYSSGLFAHRELSWELSRLYSLTRENGGEYFEYPTSNPPNEGAKNRNPQQRGAQDIYHCKIVKAADGEKLIVLTAMISPVDATVGTLKLELYIITGFMVLFSTVLALLIARHISEPIVSINNSAKTLAQGKYDTKFHAKGYREITELANTLNVAAKELSTLEELRRELIANISHDLRTPLTLISGYAEAMRDLPGENTPENAQIIVDETTRLNRLVTEVLDLSKLQSGAKRISPAPYSLTQSLRGIVERFSEFTKANGYTIHFEADAEVTITADENSVSQAVYNLVTNAVNFTGEDKTVTVRQILSNNAVTVEVSDTGKGISAEEFPHIWERYYRTGKKHKRAVIGSGIGLSIVKSVMDLHGGEYGVRSQAGQGTVFWIKFKT